MKFADLPSWELRTSGCDPAAHLALYVRDAVGLDDGGDTVSPPPLRLAPPDLRSRFPTAQLTLAGPQWVEWWRSIVAFLVDGDEHPPTGGREDFATWTRARSARLEQDVGSPPDYSSLTASPELREIVITLVDEGLAYARACPHPGPDIPGLLDLRDVVRDVARAHGVPEHALKGSIQVFAVEGPWTTEVAPGTIACALDMLTDAETVREIGRAAFVSGLRRR